VFGGVATSVTWVPGGNGAVQVGGQAMPAGRLVTEPTSCWNPGTHTIPTDLRTRLYEQLPAAVPDQFFVTNTPPTTAARPTTVG
jgi:hypothetical protein